MNIQRCLWALVAPLSFLLANCSKQPDETLSLNISLPNLGSLPQPAGSAYATLAPVHIYLNIKDSNGNVVFPNATNPSGVIPVGDLYSGSYNASPNVTLSNVNGSASSLIIKGHVLAMGIMQGGTVCNSNNGSGVTSASNSSSNLYFADLNQNPITVSIGGSSSQTIGITPNLTPISMDNFGLMFTGSNGVWSINTSYTTSSTYNASGFLTTTAFIPSAANIAPQVTMVSLVDADSQTEIIDPCLGQPLTGRADKYGRLTGSFPLRLSSAGARILVKATQFTIPPETPFTPSQITSMRLAAQAAGNATTFDLLPASTPITGCGSTTTAPNNADSIPMFWTLGLGTGKTAVMSGSASYLYTGETLAANPTPICGRINNKFNPRFADLTPVSAIPQTYLQPYNPYGQVPIVTSSVPHSATLELQLVNPSAFLYFGNSSYSTSASNANRYDALLNRSQNLNVMCVISYYSSGLYNTVGGYGTVNTNGTVNTYSNCNSIATQYGSSGLLRYLVAPITTLTVREYYQDNEGFIIASSNTSLSGGAQPTSTNPLTLTYF